MRVEGEVSLNCFPGYPFGSIRITKINQLSNKSSEQDYFWLNYVFLKKIRYSLSKIISDNDLARNIGKKGGPKRPESQLREKAYFLISARVHFQVTGIANFAMPSLSVETRIPVERVPKLLGKP